MSNPAAYAGELLHNIIEEKNNSPEYNVSIYISTLWGVKKRESGGGGGRGDDDKLNKTGDTMFGPLEMSGNKITGLSYEYPPGDLNDAVSWGQVGLRLDNYVHKGGSMMTGLLGVGRGITLGDGFVKIRGRPIEDIDATNKEYVDSKITKPIITIWAVSRGSLVSDRREWSFGGGGGDNILNGYIIPAAGRIIRAGLQLVYTAGDWVDDGTAVAMLFVNNNGYDSIETGTTVFDTPIPVSQGDIISFISTITLRNAKASTVSLLIELDL
jgi:hypothetical protein